VYPALAVLQALGSEPEAVLWVGGEGGMEESLITRAGIPFKAISAAGVHGVGLSRLPGNLLRLLRGTKTAHHILHTFKPDVLFFTGGYVGVPMALAGRNVPSLVYVPDIEPGLALKLISRFAHIIAITTPDSRRYFSTNRRLEVTGYPTRPDLRSWTREKGRQHFNIPSEEPLLLVMGGSKGARSINRALLKHLESILEFTQIIHLTGDLDWPTIDAHRQTLSPHLAQRYHPYPYLHEDIGAAFAAADLAITRAGASTLGELPLFGLPAILVPYPYAWRYQRTNATYLVERGAAVMIEDSALEEALLPTLRRLFAAPHQLKAMAGSMRALATPQAAERLADLLRNLARISERGGKDNHD
jgi:UDP-N-acetylglucosamine--N-acetylmuramyl-(pentapeptide) pyrophosphoryl-undecaprenol N-acetylglucosamine transferase